MSNSKGQFQTGKRSPRFQDLTGKTFHRLTVKNHAGVEGTNHKWLCECVCGNTKLVPSTRLRTGKTKSCGCLRRELFIERNYKHGLAYHPLYERVINQRSRCNNPKNPDYPNYGGRGIKCQWQDIGEHIRAIEEEIGLPPSPDMEIDRIDNDGHYESGNLRWATCRDNLLNSRNPNFIKYKERHDY